MCVCVPLEDYVFSWYKLSNFHFCSINLHLQLTALGWEGILQSIDDTDMVFIYVTEWISPASS